MKNIIFSLLLFSQIAFGQNAPRKYEAEMLKNPNKGGKDTREVNAVMIFENEKLIIASRRKNQFFKEIKYTEIKFVEHSFSKSPLMTGDTKELMVALLIGSPFWLMKEEKHWLSILTTDDFLVLKIENDNYRLLKMEFLIRDIDLININEDRL